MKKRKLSIFMKLTAMVLCFIIAMPMSVSAVTVDELKARQESLAAENEELKEKIKELEGDEAKAKEKLDAVLAQIKVIEQQIDAARSSIDILNKNIEKLSDEIDKSMEDYSATMEQLKERIKVLYKEGNVSTLEILLNAESLHDYSMRSELLKAVTEHDRQLMEKITNYMNETKEERIELNEEKEKLAEQKKELENKEIELANLQSENEVFISNLQGQKLHAHDTIVANEAEGETIISDIEALIAQKVAEEKAAEEKRAAERKAAEEERLKKAAEKKAATDAENARKKAEKDAENERLKTEWDSSEADRKGEHDAENERLKAEWEASEAERKAEHDAENERLKKEWDAEQQRIIDEKIAEGVDPSEIGEPEPFVPKEFVPKEFVPKEFESKPFVPEEFKPEPAPEPEPELPNDSAASSGGFNPMWPLPNGTITCYFGNGHNGLDMAGPYGIPVIAAESGQVIEVYNADTWGYSWGYYVLIYHNSTYTTRYAHLSGFAVSQGDYVKKGQIIGYEGNTGNSTGPHLHFEVYENGRRVDPMRWFR